MNTAYESFFSPMGTELNIGPHHHKPKNIRQMFILKWRCPETQLRRKSTLLSKFLYISNTFSRDLAPVNKLSREFAPGNMDVREICVRHRRPLRRQFVGFVCYSLYGRSSAVCIGNILSLLLLGKRGCVNVCSTSSSSIT